MSKSNLVLFVQRFWRNFIAWMDSGSDLQVWHESDRYGHISCWRAYDPTTGRSACFGSEEEMRMWIEQLYYR